MMKVFQAQECEENIESNVIFILLMILGIFIDDIESLCFSYSIAFFDNCRYIY